MTHSSVGSLKHVQLQLGSGPFLSRYGGFQGNLNKLPKLVMFILEQQKNSGALTVETGGCVKESLTDDILNLLVIYGGLFLEKIVSAAVLDDRKICGRHLYWWRGWYSCG